jgi:hypothetical protein
MVLMVTLTFLLAKANGPTGVATVNLVGCAVTLVAMWVIQSRARRSVEATQPTPGMQIEGGGDKTKKLLSALEEELENLVAAVEGTIVAPRPRMQIEVSGNKAEKLLSALEEEWENLVATVEGPIEAAPRAGGGRIVRRRFGLTLSRRGDGSGQWRRSAASR